MIRKTLILMAFCAALLPSCSDELCGNTCAFSRDGECDDGGDSSTSAICELGSDCDDCGPRKQ